MRRAIVRTEPGGSNQGALTRNRKLENIQVHYKAARAPFASIYAQALSVNLDVPTASSVVDQGELIVASAPGLGYDDEA